MRKPLCILSAIGIFYIVAFVFLCPNLVNAQSINEDPGEPIYQLAQRSLPDVEFENNKVYIGLWVINIYDFDYRIRSYTLDMYVFFFWIDPNIATADWYLMNGYAVDPLNVVLVDSGVTNEVKYEIYRIPARLFTPPETAADYPLDLIELKISIELLTYGYDTSLVWLKDQTGLDPDFKNPGWKTVAVELIESEHVYPLEAKPPRVEMIITQQRSLPFGIIIFSLTPPILFGVLGGVSFLFIPKSIALIGTRIGLISSIIVADILFNFTATASLPPLETVSSYAVLLLCVLIYLVINLIDTMVGLAVFLRYNTDKYAKSINLWGFLIAIIVPSLLFILALVFT